MQKTNFFKSKKNTLEHFTNLYPYQKELAIAEQNLLLKFPEQFIQRSAYCKKYNSQPTLHYHLSKMNGSNHQNSTRNYFLHSLNRYYGKFEPQYIKAIMNFLLIPANATILDSFCGSGTSLLEANLCNINSIGFDTNPFACLLSEVKTSIYKIPLSSILQKVQNYLSVQDIVKLRDKYILYPNIVSIVDKIFLLTYLSALSDNRYVKIPVWTAYKKNLKRFLRILQHYNKIKEEFIIPNKIKFGSSQIIQDNAINLLNHVKENSIDLVITSPPYLSVLDYVDNDLHSLKFLKSDILSIKINQLGNKSKTESYFWAEFYIILKNIYHVLKFDSYLVLIVGSIHKMNDTCIYLGKKIGFNLVKQMKIRRKSKKSDMIYEHDLYFKK